MATRGRGDRARAPRGGAAYKKRPPPVGPYSSPMVVLRGSCFLMSEVPLYGVFSPLCPASVGLHSRVSKGR